MERLLFYILASISHLSIISSSLYNVKNNEKLIYILGHSFIFLAMLLRILEKMRGHIATSIIGSIGHTILFVYFISEIFIRKNIPINSFTFYMAILCILAQIGMIIVYWDEYIEEEDIEYTGSLEKFMIINKYISVLLLCVFYFSNLFNSKQASYIIPNLLMTFTYLMALYLEIMKG